MFRSSPRAWGCFLHLLAVLFVPAVFPTCVGVFPPRSTGFRAPDRLPHVRGGVSSICFMLRPRSRSSPRAWGCFRERAGARAALHVFPTCVGVFPRPPAGRDGAARLPHVRGGVSQCTTSPRSLHWSSPRAWGCFQGRSRQQHRPAVFPTCVGVFPRSLIFVIAVLGLPHVRGGVSMRMDEHGEKLQSSPRAWGCFLQVGVLDEVKQCLPHVRGGVSSEAGPGHPGAGSSPRAWGCFSTDTCSSLTPFVFPTCVGVFPSQRHPLQVMLGLPHVRGGVSDSRMSMYVPIRSSPRAWGCFSGRADPPAEPDVFPTCVGVFPGRLPGSPAPHRLPHVRGGVSKTSASFDCRRRSSPRAWGCFRHRVHLRRPARVFPTCVGVFLRHQGRLVHRVRLPHVRGGVSNWADWYPGGNTSSPRAWGCFHAPVTQHLVPEIFPSCVGVFVGCAFGFVASVGAILFAERIAKRQF